MSYTGDPYRRPIKPTYTSQPRTISRQKSAGLRSRALKYAISLIASPARVTADSAAATNERPTGNSLSSEVWLRNTRCAEYVTVETLRPSVLLHMVSRSVTFGTSQKVTYNLIPPPECDRVRRWRPASRRDGAGDRPGRRARRRGPVAPGRQYPTRMSSAAARKAVRRIPP